MSKDIVTVYNFNFTVLLFTGHQMKTTNRITIGKQQYNYAMFKIIIYITNTKKHILFLFVNINLITIL